jgi:peptidoglycan/xylan/chitin deacetylase (PgdA/CDA1 family)
MKTELYYRLGAPWLRIHALLRTFSGFPQRGFRILTFHDVFEDQLKSFEKLVDYVMEHHGVLAPEDVEKIAGGSKALPDDSRVPCLITFDDGYVADAITAKKILNARGIKAAFFVCPSLMDIPRERQNAVIFEQIYEKQAIPAHRMFMSWKDLESLLAAGHTVGSHTLSHQRLSRISNDERKKEIIDSADVLQNRLGANIRWFAYPFGNIGSIDAESYKIIRTRYEFCCTGLRGLNTPPLSPLALLRDPIDPASPFDYQRLSLSGGLDFLYSRSVKQLLSWTK